MITAAAVQKLKPDPSKRLEVPDGRIPGLYLVVQPSGKKSWALRYRHNGASRKLTFPGFPSLEHVRRMALESLDLIATGADPAAERKESKRRARSGEDNRNLVKNVAALFLELHAKGNRTLPEIQRMLRVDVLPLWGERPITEITKRDVRELLDSLVARLHQKGANGVMANRVFGVIRRMFSWAVSRDILEATPCDGITPPIKETSRDRVLNDDEVRWLWLASDELGYPFGPLTKLLILTGQRLSEVGGATFAEMDLSRRMWTIPRDRVKNKRVHEVPLSEQAIAIVQGLPRIGSKNGFLFTTTGRTPVSGFGRAKRNLDAGMVAHASEEAMSNGRDEPTIPDWRFHDLRRSAASGMARLQIDLPVIEKVLNHVSGSFGGIVGVYQRYSFAEEKRRALDAWAKFVTALAAGGSGP